MINVAAAIIEDGQGRLLIARRRQGKSQGGLWEFPGGKIEAGESPEECLRRELAEEMDIDIRPYAYFGTSDYSYDTLSVRLIAYKAAYAGGTIRLTDHDAYRWVQAAELSEFDFAPADKPFVDKLAGLG